MTVFMGFFSVTSVSVQRQNSNTYDPAILLRSSWEISGTGRKIEDDSAHRVNTHGTIRGYAG